MPQAIGSLLKYLKGKLPALILNTQVANSLVAVLFFYLIPSFGITPKTILATHLVISFAFVVLWRVSLVPRFGFRHRDRWTRDVAAAHRNWQR